MVNKFVLEGWIRARLDFPELANRVADTNQFYFNNHREFNLEDEFKSTRIKQFEFTDKEDNIQYAVTFGYDEVGARFTIVTDANVKDRITMFESSLSRAVRGYKNFKEHFLREICPRSIEIQFNSGTENLLLTTFGFFEGLDQEEQNNLIKQMKSILKKYTSHVRFVLTYEGLVDYSDENEIRILTMKELEEMPRFDFSSVVLACGEISLFVGHHLFGISYFLEDPSLSLVTVAEWGLISSLKLQDLHYEIKDYSQKVGNLKKILEEVQKKRIPSGLDIRREELIGLEKTEKIIENDLREFTNLSNRIYEGLESHHHSTKLLSALDTMQSLPHSLYQAYGILTLQRLGRYSGLRREVIDLSAELRILELKFKKAELYITLTALVVLLLAIPVSIYASRIEIGYIADIFQILTFIVAFVLLILRVWPKR